MNRREFTKSSLLSVAALALPLSVSANDKKIHFDNEDVYVLTKNKFNMVDGTNEYQYVFFAGTILDNRHSEYFEKSKGKTFDLKLRIRGQLKIIGEIKPVVYGGAEDNICVLGSLVGFEDENVSVIGIKPTLLGKKDISYYIVTEFI